MPVPAEAIDSTNSRDSRVELQSANSSSSGEISAAMGPGSSSSSNEGIQAPPAPSTPVSAPSNDQAASPGAEESSPAYGNGGPGVTSPIEMANGDQPL